MEKNNKEEYFIKIVKKDLVQIINIRDSQDIKILFLDRDKTFRLDMDKKTFLFLYEKMKKEKLKFHMKKYYVKE